ncbi:nuclear protein DGCR14 [Phellopilus nigrolimitatus]|nr:nuclear protein DGCR14 [Phellopilus nigrolimitatus]
MSELTSTSQTPRPESSQPSLYRQAVLEEDEYTEALSHIIARDFFPSLVHLDATNNYLDALRTEDPQLINASVRQLQDLATPAIGRYRPQQTPSQTPWATGPSDTPLRTPVGGERPLKRARYNMDMSLDSFQSKYTSEDNSSFTQILDDENRKRREKYGWAWDAQKRVEAQRDRMIEARERLLIEPSSAPGIKERLVIEAPKPAGLITQGDGGGDIVEEDKENETQIAGDEEESKEESKEVVVASKLSTAGDEDNKEQVDVMAPKKDTRPAGVDGWKFKTRNAFMFPPDADIAPYAAASSSTAPLTRGDPKAIKHINTRLPEQNETSSSGHSEPPSPTRSRIDAAIAGTPYRPRSPTNNGFLLLPSLPSPTPSELGPSAVKQLMTWGTLNATPRILSTSDDPADASSSDLPPPITPFHLPTPSTRETISHRLSNNAVKSLRVKAALMGGGSSGLGFRTPTSTRGRGDGSMPPPSWTPRRADSVGSLTPAAKRLLDRSTTGVANARRADAMGKTTGWESNKAKAKERDLNKVRWTPSPAPVARKR